MSYLYVSYYGGPSRITEVTTVPLAMTGREASLAAIIPMPVIQHIISSGNFLYAFGEIPGSLGIYRINPSTMVLVDTVSLGDAWVGFSGSNQNLATDGTYLYAVAAPSPLVNSTRVYRIRLSDFTLVDSIATNIGSVPLISNIDEGNGFLYVGDWFATTIDKVRLSDFTLVNSMNMTIVSYTQMMLVKGNYLYVVNGRNLGGLDRLCRINLVTFTEDTNLNTAAAEPWGWGMAADDTYLYLGLATAGTPTKIVRFTLDPFVRVDALTLAGYMDAWTLLIDGGFLVVVLEETSTSVHKIRRSTFTLEESLAFGWPPYTDSWSSALWLPASTPTTSKPAVATLPATGVT